MVTDEMPDEDRLPIACVFNYLRCRLGTVSLISPYQANPCNAFLLAPFFSSHK